ncbi:MAG: four helix bundle protein [Terrimicrobiaceae bacterium]
METGKKSERNADFQKRTFDYALRILHLVESLPKSETNRILGKQLLRSGTSVGANSRAAKRSRSRAEFVSKLGIVEEEADESLFWIELLTAAGKVSAAKVGELVKETNEILAITVASIKTARPSR